MLLHRVLELPLTMKRRHNHSLQPTQVGRLGSAFAVDILNPAWLSSSRYA
jgi:hypothetical protein